MGAVTPVTIIAEAAQGFEGEPRLASLLVRAAAAAGADVVKFQLVYADELATRDYAHYELFKQLEMSNAAWADTARDANAAGLGIAFDVFGSDSLALAVELGAAFVKIHASDFFNEALVEQALVAAPRVLFSAGGIAADEIAGFLDRAGAHSPKLTLMYGFQAEPTPIEANHLARLGTLRRRFPDVSIGFMDHAEGSADEAGWVALLALPYGVRVVEKHLTLARSVRLEDYVSALEPREFATFVARLRLAERALGMSDLTPTPMEQSYRQRAVKVVVARVALPPGHRVGASDIALLRAKVGPDQLTLELPSAAIGRTVKRSIEAGQPLGREDLA